MLAISIVDNWPPPPTYMQFAPTPTLDRDAGYVSFLTPCATVCNASNTVWKIWTSLSFIPPQAGYIGRVTPYTGGRHSGHPLGLNRTEEAEGSNPSRSTHKPPPLGVCAFKGLHMGVKTCAISCLGKTCCNPLQPAATSFNWLHPVQVALLNLSGILGHVHRYGHDQIINHISDLVLHTRD